MTEQEITEGNKLIANFQGLELVNINDEPEDKDFDCWVFRNKITGQSDSGEEGEIYDKDSTLPFHDDWNLLMPVVYKILFTTMFSEYGITYQLAVQQALGNCKITGLHGTVVEFIKFCNENKKNG